jgi:hypothetical chaperone protein
MRIGIDFGTSNSSGFLFRDGKLEVIKSKSADPSGILPSLLYITRSFESFLGKEAALKYLIDNTGRPAIWQTYHAGVIQYWVGIDPEPELITEDIWLQEDIGAKGRLLQSIKTGLRSEHYVGTSIFGRFYTIQDLIALILREFRVAANETFGQNVDEILLGHPVKFHENPDKDKKSKAILRDAAKDVGFKDVHFMPEPIAAAYSYHISLNERHTALVFDFGGGTLDLAVVHIGGKQEPVVLSTEGVQIGGDDFDQRIMEKFLLKHFGHQKTYENDVYLPFNIYEHLLSWPRHPDLTRGWEYTQIRRAASVCKTRPEFKALLTLIDNKHGYNLFRTIESAKIALSKKRETILSFHVDDINIDEKITREAFSASIQDYCLNINQSLERVVKKANMLNGDIDFVLCTGGSSSVAAIQKLLTKRFGKKKIRQHDPFLGVSSGLAIAANLYDK